MEQQSLPDIQPVVQCLVVGPWATNCYIVSCPTTGETLIIDPAANHNLILESVADLKPKMIVLTHGHLDHISAVRRVKSGLGIPLGFFPLDAGLAQLIPDVALSDEQVLSIGGLGVKVLHTPGHTPGSITFQIGLDVFVGDLLFSGGPGSTRTPRDFQRILHSITSKILPLPPVTMVNPGHGDVISVATARKEVSEFLRKPARPDICGDVRWATS